MSHRIDSGARVREFALTKVAPNPSRGAVGLEFTVSREAQVRLSVLDVQGREVAVLASGLYFVRYQTPERSFVRRVVINPQ